MVGGEYASHPTLESPKRYLNGILRQGRLRGPPRLDERLCGYEDDDLFQRMFRAGFDNVSVPYLTWRVHSWSCGASDRYDNPLQLYIRKLLDSFPDDLWRGALLCEGYGCTAFR
jgi:hypothetical protein